MSLLSFFGGAVQASPEQPSTLVAPYNASTFLALPRVYDHDNATHPDVLDFGSDPARWFGKDPHRFWMAFTPFPPANHEDPSILCSHDGQAWTVPVGLTNPIEPAPGNGAYNSDTDLVFDPVAKRLGCVWRTFYPAGSNGNTADTAQLYIRWSQDGVVWSERLDVMTNAGPASPSFVRMSDGSWLFWSCGGGGIHHYAAKELSGPWEKRPVIVQGLTGLMAWHTNVIYHRNQYRMVLRCTDGKFYPGVSENGNDWRFGPAMMTSVHAWEGDGGGMYRATMTPHENEADYRFWYGTTGSTPGWRIGYTLVPQSLWTSLG